MKKIFKIAIIFIVSFWITIIRLYMFVPVKVINDNNYLKYITITEYNEKMKISTTCIDCIAYELDINKYRIEAFITFIISLLLSTIIYIIIRKILKSKND